MFSPLHTLLTKNTRISAKVRKSSNNVSTFLEPTENKAIIKDFSIELGIKLSSAIDYLKVLDQEEFVK